MVVHIVVIAIAVISCAAGLALLIYNALYDKFSVITNAVIVKIEEKEKYIDSSYQKQYAYDYFYAYTDLNGIKRNGKLVRNSPSKEFSEGDTICIRYVKLVPALSLYQKIPIIPYVMLAMSVILFVFSLII